MAEPSPLSDADKIRLKRIARLQQQQAQPQQDSHQPVASTSASPAASPSTPTALPAPRPAPQPAKQRPSVPPTPATPAKQPRTAIPASSAQAKFADSFEDWEGAVVGRILNVTLDVDEATRSNWQIVYLKEVAEEISTEEPALPKPLKLRSEWTDRLLLSRLSLSPSHMTDDPELVTVIASLPADQTTFEYLGGAWRRERAERFKIVAKKDSDAEQAKKRLEVLNSIKALLVSYMGLVLMDPTMFPQDHITSKPVGPLELEPLLIPSSTSP
ncbi:hypothetical protein JCM1841_006546, partial [Sporobolomyces salmonicolor]